MGTAVGDALGLPYEGLTPKRAARLFKEIDRYHFFLKHGMVSDDTEHTCLAARMNATEKIIKGNDYIEKLKKLLPDPDSDEFIGLVSSALNSSLKSRSTKQFAKELNLEKGITGYIYHTVPMVIHSWLTHPKDFRSGIFDIISCGGDTDTTAAILGGIIGGKEGIPRQWLDRLWEWPRTVKWMEKLAKQLKSRLDGDANHEAVTVPFPLIVVRNFIFTIVILIHGFRRMFPPY